MERCGRVACFHNAGDQRDVSRGCFKMRWSFPNPFLSTWVLRAVWRGREAASVARHWGCVSLHHEAGHPHPQRRSPGEAALGGLRKRTGRSASQDAVSRQAEGKPGSGAAPRPPRLAPRAKSHRHRHSAARTRPRSVARYPSWDPRRPRPQKRNGG